LHREEQPFDVAVEHFVKVGFGNLPEGSEFPNTGVGENDIEAAMLLLHRGIEAI